MADSKPLVAPGRDHRIDVLRGLCLTMIFINHTPPNVFEGYTNRNFGFSDAAEGFVLLAGVAAGLAYGNDFRKHAYWRGTARIWSRAWTLYLVHILITLLAIAVAAAGAKLGAPDTIRMHGIWFLVEQPLGFLIGLPLLTHQIGYVNILPLYFVLLMILPPLLWATLRWPGRVLLGSLVIWAICGHFKLNFPTYPAEGGWFLSPFSWQVLLVVGVQIGLAQKQGVRMVPVRLWLQWLSGGFLLFCLIWMLWPAFAELMRTGLVFAASAGASELLTSFNKVYLALPRLLHIMALAYFLSTLPILHRWANSKLAAPFALLGRQSLPVFALGTVLAFVVQTIKTEVEGGLLIDTLLIGGGLALQLALAAARQHWPKDPAPKV